MDFGKKAFIALVASVVLPVTSVFCTIPVVTLFSHGIADTWKQVHMYVRSYSSHGLLYHNNNPTIHTPFISFNYPDATDKFYRVNYAETSFGQENELARINSAYQKTVKHYGDSDIILYGLSRGASNIAIFAGLYDIPQVKAIVLESPYCTMGEVIENIMYKKGLGWIPISYGETLAEFLFQKYTRHGYSPANCVEKIAKDIPILIICSEEDTLVPAATSFNVYKKLRESGHDHVYIFTTQQGKHAAILSGPDGHAYEDVVNAFYEKYNLPHCSFGAARGKIHLDNCQPLFN